MFVPLNKLCWHVGREFGTGLKSMLFKGNAAARLEVSHCIVACGFNLIRRKACAQRPLQGPWLYTKILGFVEVV